MLRDISYRNKMKRIFYLVLSHFLIFTILIVPLNSAQASNTMGMPDYTKGIVVDQHYIIINQTTTHSLVVEEQITLRNTASENHTENIFTWSQPGDILKEITLFEFVINGTREFINPTPLGNFLKSNLSANNVSIKPQETFKHNTRYSLAYSSTDKFYFGTTFLYNTTEVLIVISPKEGYSVEGVENVKLIYQPSVGIYATEHTTTLSMELGELIRISFTKETDNNDGNGDGETKEKDDDEPDSNLYLILLVIIIIVILTILIRFYFHKKSLTEQKENSQQKQKQKRKTIEKSTTKKSQKVTPSRTRSKSRSNDIDDSEGERSPVTKKKAKNRSDLVLEKKKILKTQKRIKRDYKDELITEETYAKLKMEYKQKLKIINKRIEKFDKEGGAGTGIDTEDESKELKKLLTKKKKILKAINKLEDDREEGIIDDELYEEMAGAYKKQAIEIMKSIDQIKEN